MTMGRAAAHTPAMIQATPATEGWLAAVQPSDLGGRLELRPEGGRIGLYTSAALIRRNQRQARVAGLLALGLGVGLLAFSLWSATLVVVGLVLLFVVPRRQRPARLLEIDGRARLLTITQDLVGAGEAVAIDEIDAIRGQYATKGWDGFSLVYARLRDGREVQIAELLGTDERLAEAFCRTLGKLLGRPASYAGPFGSTQSWAAPSECP